MNMGLFGALLIYIALLLALSFLFFKRKATVEDFFLASRRLSAFPVFLTVTASWIGAISLLVTMDEARRQGLGSIWIMAAPAVVTLLVFALILAGPIRRLPIVTLSDLVEARYGLAVRHMASVLIVWYMVLLAASQMVALGQFLGPLLGTSYFLSLTIGTLVVLIYASAGGLLSVVVTDGVQFLLLTAGIIGLAIWSFNNGRLEFPSDSALDLLGGRGLFADFRTNFLIFLSFALAWIISPITWQRIQGARSVQAAKKGLWMSGGALALIYAVLIMVGINAPASLSGDGPFLSSLIRGMPGSPLGLILFIAVLAAVMSTMDTAVNTGALSLSHDVLGIWKPPLLSGERGPGINRLSTVLVGLAAFLVATRFQSILTTLGLASEIMAEGLFIPGIAMIFLKGRFPWAGILSLGAGGGFSLLSFFCRIGLLSGLPVWPYSLPYGLGLSAMGFMIGTVLDRRFRRRT
jgi:SSS family solute:Na+ symporter